MSLAGLLVPIPLIALDMLIGGIQAYIFAILAMVFIAGALGDEPAANRDLSPNRSSP
jgi:F-type H+-transporting ATPase subunit a